MQNDPVGAPWVIAPALSDLPPIARISEADAAPEPLPRWVGWTIALLLSFGLWTVLVALVDVIYHARY